MQTAPSRVLLIKLGAIGDVVNTLPLAQRLRAAWPEARLEWAIGPLAHRLVAGHGAIDEFLEFDSKRAGAWLPFVRELRRRRYDLVLDLQRLLKSGGLARLSGAPRRLGFDRARCKESSWLFTNEHIPPNPAPGVTVAQYLEFADHLGAPEAPPSWDLPFEPWSGEAPVAVLNLGASKPANLWPNERWAAVATQLAERHGPERVALSGGPADREAADAVLSSAPAGILDAVGALSLKQTAGLIAASRVFVGCDTGPLHIAVAVGTPVVALFGAADPARTGPFGQPQSVLYEGAPCSPCRKRHCFVDGHPCMTKLEVERVVTAALRAADSETP